jgi:hypothetical protein
MTTQEQTAIKLLDSLEISEQVNTMWLDGVEFTRNANGDFVVSDKVELC